MKPRKILLIVTQSDLGGAQRYVHDLSAALSTDGCSVTVACGSGGPLIGRIERSGVRVLVFPELVRPIRPWSDGKAFWRIYALLREERFDIIHSNSSKAGFLTRLAGRAAAVGPSVFTAHGFVFQEARPAPERAGLLFLEKLAGVFTDRLITVCEADRELALRHRIVPFEKVVTVHNGIVPSLPTPRTISRSMLKLPADAILVGCVANFYANKGVLDFVHLAEHLARRRSDIIFALAGHGPQYPEVLNAIRRSRLTARIRLLGHVSEAWRMMTAFDVFVLTSRKEGLPYALLEAMNAGVPIVATRVGGVPEAIVDGETGYLVPPGDPAEAADRVERLLRRPRLARQLASAARRKVVEYFNLDRMIEETKKVYHELC